MLETKSDLSTITLKLASMIIENKKVSGSEKIGKSKKEIEKLILQFENEKRGQNRRKGSYKRGQRKNLRSRRN
jgi:ATP-dependent RNA helicase DeaD